jgi:hypothetical protein
MRPYFLRLRSRAVLLLIAGLQMKNNQQPLVAADTAHGTA